MSVLIVNDTVDFNMLKDLLNTTDGNLASHLNVLEKNSLILVKKQFIGRKPNTRYKITELGRFAFSEHLEYLEKLIKQDQRAKKH
jgi:DNA-binding HxlR family transcriptional regulator